MSTQPVSLKKKPLRNWGLTSTAKFPRLRALAWDGSVLYGSRGYDLLRADMSAPQTVWRAVASYQREWWRQWSSGSRLAFRLLRGGFHALAVLPSGHLVAAVAGAIITAAPQARTFRISHRITRGTRPLHFAVTHEGHVFWGEYFDNPQRDEVQIYGSVDCGASWQVAYTFPKKSIRHVHNIVFDEWEKCLWVLTGDDGEECRILKASCDFSRLQPVLSGDQQARAVAMVPAEDGLYFSSDTPMELNHIYRLTRHGELERLAPLSSSSIYGCRAGRGIFFSTMIEPSEVNRDRNVRLYGSMDGGDWQSLAAWEKDGWPMGLFQFGNAAFPDGRNTTNLLAATTVAVRGADLETNIWSLP